MELKLNKMNKALFRDRAKKLMLLLFPTRFVIRLSSSFNPSKSIMDRIEKLEFLAPK